MQVKRLKLSGFKSFVEPAELRVEPGLTHRVENTGRLPLRYYVCSSPGTDPLDDREPAEAPPRTLDA